MVRPLRRGDVVVADATVFNDFLSRLGIARRDPNPSLQLLDGVRSCCARFGYTNRLLAQYLSSEPQARPVLGGSFQKIANLVGSEKLFVSGASAGSCDDQDPLYRQLPVEDRFLLDVAAAVEARFIVTTDPGIPLGQREVRIRGGGRLQVEIVTPSELSERIES